MNFNLPDGNRTGLVDNTSGSSQPTTVVHHLPPSQQSQENCVSYGQQHSNTNFQVNAAQLNQVQRPSVPASNNGLPNRNTRPVWNPNMGNIQHRYVFTTVAGVPSQANQGLQKVRCCHTVHCF